MSVLPKNEAERLAMFRAAVRSNAAHEDFAHCLSNESLYASTSMHDDPEQYRKAFIEEATRGRTAEECVEIGVPGLNLRAALLVALHQHRRVVIEGRLDTCHTCSQRRPGSIRMGYPCPDRRAITRALGMKEEA